MDNADAPDWATFYGERRVLPFLREARLPASDVALVERAVARLPEVAGPAEPPARIHGDLWSGNVLWSCGQGVLIDPAAHGGHRETDLAMLDLFGLPRLDRVLGGLPGGVAARRGMAGAGAGASAASAARPCGVVRGAAIGTA
ncbi:fructosamine kinase family protein [Nonomuraea salmonea]|uniref:fructosamine kinase family protein n=1 Tax=Nonomuraea salmonea TaxID=46181 RepID=UPI002FE9A7AA